MQEWKIYKVSLTISNVKRKAPEGTWVLGGGIEIPCKYFLYGPVIHKKIVRKEGGRGVLIFGVLRYMKSANNCPRFFPTIF